MRLCLGGGELFVEAVGRVSPRRASHFLLLRQKKVTKEKATHCLRPLRFATGQPAVLAFRGVSQNSLHCVPLRQLRALIRETLRSSAQPEGWVGPSLRSATDTQQAFASLGPGERRPRAFALSLPHTRTRHGALTLIPSGCAEERRRKRDKGRSCLSEASSADPRFLRAPQVARSEAEGHRQRGRLFFAYFLLAKQKKVGRPPGRDPANDLTNRRKGDNKKQPVRPPESGYTSPPHLPQTPSTSPPSPSPQPTPRPPPSQPHTPAPPA